MLLINKPSVVLTLLTPGQEGHTIDQSVNIDQVKSIKSTGQHHIILDVATTGILPVNDHIQL